MVHQEWLESRSGPALAFVGWAILGEPLNYIIPISSSGKMELAISLIPISPHIHTPSLPFSCQDIHKYKTKQESRWESTLCLLEGKHSGDPGHVPAWGRATGLCWFTGCRIPPACASASPSRRRANDTCFTLISELSYQYLGILNNVIDQNRPELCPAKQTYFQKWLKNCPISH